jgi:hypothetical protein
MATWERLHASALILVVAIDQILAFERRVSDITGDTELAAARTEFDGVAPHADALRDIVAHLDSYAVGEGFRQKGRRGPPVSGTYMGPLIWWTEDGSTRSCSETSIWTCVRRRPRQSFSPTSLRESGRST